MHSPTNKQNPRGPAAAAEPAESMQSASLSRGAAQDVDATLRALKPSPRVDQHDSKSHPSATRQVPPLPDGREVNGDLVLSTLPIQKRGGKGEWVGYLQARLNERGANITVDCDYGPRTSNAVKVFQKGQDLPPTGVVDAATWGALLQARGAVLNQPVAPKQLPRMEGLQELKAGTHPYMRDLQRAQEGLRLEAYECSAGKWSIGYGRNLEVKGREADYRRYAGTGRQITGEQAEKWLAEDLSVAYRELEKNFGSERWFQDLSVNRKIALTSMSFNLGLPTLRKFEEMFAELRAGDFKGAARESLDSKWAGQVGTPAQGVAYILEHDTLPDLKVALANQGLR